MWAVEVTSGDHEIDATGSGWVDVMWASNETLVGFQFDLTNLEITSVDGGLTQKLDWGMNHNSFRVLGYALGVSSYIPPLKQDVVLTRVHFEGISGDVAIEVVIFVNDSVQEIKVDSSHILVIGDSCNADINGDLVVNVTDLLQVVSEWGQSNVPADINQDGIVNVTDILAVIDAWGPC